MAKQEDGSAHVIIIVGIVLILCATLGAVFYQQFTNKKNVLKSSEKNDVAKVTQKPAVKTVPTQDFSLTSGSRTISMKYPEGWKVESKEQADTANVSRTITSPDGKYTIHVSLINDGLGGTAGDCPLVYASASLTDIPNGTGELLFEYTTEPTSGSTQNGDAGAVVVSNATQKSDLSVGNAGCAHESQTFNEDGTFQVKQGEPAARVILQASDGDGNPRIMTLKQQKSWLSTDEYRIAIKALLTVKG